MAGAAGDLTGRQLGAYRLEARLGDGAFGRVYRARHVVLDIPRAVKVMQAEIALDPQFRERFLREARTAAQLHDPNVVAVVDFGNEGDIQFLVMEYVESTTLAEQLARLAVPGRLGNPAVRRWLRDIASGLDHAHGYGIVHRDLKPANVLVRTDENRAMLTDFGIARARTDPRLTMTGQSVGTYAYMSPEQCEGVEELTSACDIYALAAVVYEIAAGDPPFGRGVSAVSGHMQKPMPALRLTAPGLPPGLDAVLARGLAKAPADRHPTATQLANAVLAAVPEGVSGVPAAPVAVLPVDQTVVASPGWTPPEHPVPVVVTPVPVVRRPRRLPGLRVVAAAAAALLGVGIVLTVVHAAQGGSTPGPAPTLAPGPTATAETLLPDPVSGAVGSAVQVAGLRLSVLSVDTSAPATRSLPLPAGTRLVTIRVQYSGAQEVAPISPYDWVLTDRDGAMYTVVVDGLSGALPERSIGPDQTVRGQIGFIVPRTAPGLVLHFDAQFGDSSAQIPLD
jgi:serine/threonine-protein kinase